MRIKNLIASVLTLGVLTFSGCEKTTPSDYLINRADIPGTLENYECWNLDEDDEELMALNQIYYYHLSPARDQGMENALAHPIFCRMNENEVRTIGLESKGLIPCESKFK
jgi:hypothetical protein